MSFLSRLTLAGVLLIAAGVAAPQEQQSPEQLVRQAQELEAKDPAKHRAEIEQLLFRAVELWRSRPTTRKEDFAEASVMLSLYLLGSGASTDRIFPLIDDALGVYEAGTASETDGRLALALEAKAVALAEARKPEAEVNAARSRAAAIRRGILDERRRADEAGQTPVITAERLDPKIMQPPKVEQKQEPAYSEAGRIAKYQGTALLSLVIDAEGKPRNIRLERSLGFGLDEAAYDAVRSWRFRPAVRDGSPIPVTAKVEINFRLR